MGLVSIPRQIISRATTKLLGRSDELLFKRVHSRTLLYNACFEDPRIDRELLQLDHTSKAVMLTSAGCNTLDYALDNPAEIHAVDINPSQNALLQLKLKLIEQANFADLFAAFGQGSHRGFKDLYYSLLRAWLPLYARHYWDGNCHYFNPAGLKKSFYYNGISGNVAWLVRQYLKANKNLTGQLYRLLDATSLEKQKEIYAQIEAEFWAALCQWVAKNPLALTVIGGVPWPQIQLIEQQYRGGLAGYLRDKLRNVMTSIPISDNYFWRVYLTGSYTCTCCPNYLKPEHFDHLKANSAAIQTYTGSLAEFLEQHPGPYSHFVLLDHQDWLAWHKPAVIAEEWRLILRASRPGSKILMRSAIPEINFLPDFVQSSLRFFPELTTPLHPKDRVGIYSSLHLAEVI
jgi:S-adenosylmethionine-diacylglycerol 3-amino-3-carboxypropyl transferase